MYFNKIKYLGGLPHPFGAVCMIDILVSHATQQHSFKQGTSNCIVFDKTDIIDVETEIKQDRSIGKGLVGYAVGSFINKKYGGFIGAAIGAKRKDVSMVYIKYVWNNKQNTIVLNPGKQAWDIFAAINSFIA